MSSEAEGDWDWCKGAGKEKQCVDCHGPGFRDHCIQLDFGLAWSYLLLLRPGHRERGVLRVK